MRLTFSVRRRPARLSRGALALAAALAAAGCAERPGDIAPTLEPVEGSRVWPGPPDQPRYALADVLIGEKNFFAEGDDGKSGAEKAFEVIVGLVTGGPDFRELQRPVSGLVREDGAILVVDAGLKGVAVFDLAEKLFRVWTRADDHGGFASPVGIAKDGAGGYLVTDADLARVIRLSPEGEPLGSFGRGVLRRPTGIARDPQTGEIYVADTDANDIKVFTPSGDLEHTIGSPGREPGRLNTPTLLHFADDRLWVADTLNFRIQAFDRGGDVVQDFGEVGLFVGNLSRPKGVAVGGGGRIYVVESYYDHLLVFDPEGRLLLPIGGTGPEIGQFYLPSGVWTDDQDRVYVADMFNGRVVVLKELTGLTGLEGVK